MAEEILVAGTWKKSATNTLTFAAAAPFLPTVTETLTIPAGLRTMSRTLLPRPLAGANQEIKKSGKATDAAFMSSEHGGFAIFDVASGAELADLSDSCPARPFCSVETMGLMTPKEAEPVLAKAKARAAEAMQMMAKFAGPR